MIRPIRTILCVVVWCGVGFADQGTWPQFRGPNGQGVSSSSHALPAKLDAGTQLWKTKIPHGVSCPCISDGRVFLTGHDVERSELITVCLDSGSGDQIWEKRAKLSTIPSTHIAGSPAAPTIAADGRRIYVYFGLIGVTTYDYEGNLIWQQKLPAPRNRHGASSSPVVVDDRVFVVCDQGELFRSMGSYVLCLDAETGKQRWKKLRPLSGAGWSTPVVSPDGKELIVMGRRVIAYDLDDGHERWWFDGLMDFALTTPAVGTSTVYVVAAAGGFETDRRIQLPTFAAMLSEHDANHDGQLVQDELPAEMLFYQGDTTGLPGDGVTAREAFAMFDADQNARVNEQEWDGAVGLWNQMQNRLVALDLGGRGNVTQTHVRWEVNKQLPEVPSPLLHDGYLYLIKNGGIVTCLQASTGKTVYRKRLGAVGNYFASPVSGDQKIYAASDRGEVTTFTAGSEFKVLARSRFNEQLIATPAIAGSNVFIRTAKHLFCFAANTARQ